MDLTPIKQSYWVTPGKFLAGEYPRTLDDDSSIVKLKLLVQAGVSSFIDLTEEDEGLHPYSYLLQDAGLDKSAHQRFSIPDVSVPDSINTTVNILDAIDENFSKNKLIYLHCWGGVGRTGTIVGCWLVRHGFIGQAALDKLRELWEQCPKSAYRESPETPDQIKYILAWKEAQ